MRGEWLVIRSQRVINSLTMADKSVLWSSSFRHVGINYHRPSLKHTTLQNCDTKMFIIRVTYRYTLSTSESDIKDVTSALYTLLKAQEFQESSCEVDLLCLHSLNIGLNKQLYSELHRHVFSRPPELGKALLMKNRVGDI